MDQRVNHTVRNEVTRRSAPRAGRLGDAVVEPNADHHHDHDPYYEARRETVGEDVATGGTVGATPLGKTP
jgi:hypothetical protein